jgi:predicted acylesterase/phospholipase RssA
VIQRRDFLLRAGAAGLAPALLAEAVPPTGPLAPRRDFLDRALVLSGGGARGAYEGGVIWQLAKAAGIADGQPLRPYGFVAGTSIGALNGWFVATGQYSRLYNLWHTIGSQDIIQLKPQFAKVTQAHAGVANRLISALRLLGLTKNEQGVAETKPVLDWLKREIDENTPLVMPFVWAATDLTTQQPEYFYRVATGRGPAPEFIFQSLRLTIGPHVVVREATNDILHRSLMASANLPFVFDPVLLPDRNGIERQYVDGGVASNSPVAVARTVAKAVDVVLLDPQLEHEFLPNATEIGLASFGTMQRKILETELRQTQFQSSAKAALERLDPAQIDALVRDSSELRVLLRDLPITTLAYLRPEKTLPVKVGAFDDQVHIDETFHLGETDVLRGFTPYDWATFQY